MNTLDQLRAGELRGITRLSLSADLHDVPAEIFTLADSLEILDLSGNALSTLPDDLPRLHRLRVVFCANNRFTELPEVLGRCDRLEMVGFKANQIRHVSGAALPPQLRWLILTDNQIESLPDELGDRPRLQKLALAGNRLRRLPSLAKCHALELLRISANHLTAIPDDLLQLPRLAWLAHGGNPFSASIEADARARAAIPAVSWDDLTLDQLLGQGASGHIYRAHQADGTPTALKVFKGELTSDGLPGTELAACLRAGDHPHLISVRGQLRDHPAQAQGLLMPLIGPEFHTLAGPPSLASCSRDVYAENERFTLEAALELAIGIASAMAHLHERGLTHGDLYAHNILHDGEGHALLGDFGAASFLDAAQAHQRDRLKAMDVRAFGYLLEELVERTAPGATIDLLVRLRDACLDQDPDQRPPASTVVEALTSVR